MQWIKSHLTYVITASIGAIAIAVLIMGMMMSTVAEDMERDRSILSNLKSMKPVNQKMIELAKKEGEASHARVEKAQKELESKGDHKPIVAQVFPKIDKANETAPYLFRDEYKKRQQKLLMEVLHAMDAPNEDEYKRGESWLMNQKNKKGLEGMGVTQTAPAGRRPGVGTGLSNTYPIAPPTGIGPSGFNTLTPEETVQARIRVSIQRAHQVYCYATAPTPGNSGSLDPRPAITDGAGLPTVDDMWYAQMSLWIQEDILSALAQLNNSTAEKLPEKERWVANLPVKHLWNIWVGNYVPPASSGSASTAARFAPAGGSGGAEIGPPSGDSASVLTQRGTTANSVDVIQFALKLVVDAQSLPAVIDEICKAGFYTPLRVNYEAISPRTDNVGYIYGSDPVLQVRLEFEGCFLRPKYTKWMPEDIAKAINEGKAGTQLSVGGGGGGGGSPSMMRPGSGGGPGGPARPGGRFDRGS